MEKKFGKRGKKQKKASIVKHCDPEIPPSSLIFAINADGFSHFPSLPNLKLFNILSWYSNFFTKHASFKGVSVVKGFEVA